MLMSHRAFPARCPVIALLGQVLTLLELLSPEIAGNQRVAVAADAIGEVLTRHANPVAFPAPKLSVIDKAPLLHPQVLR